MGPTQVSTSYSKFQTSTLNPSERINPFDKNKPSTGVTSSSIATLESTSSVSSSVTSSSYTSSFDKYQGTTATTITTTNQSTSRYVAPTTSSSLYSSDSVKSTTSALGSSTTSYATGSDLTKTEYSVTSSSDENSRKKPADTITSKTVSSSQRANAAKYAFETSKYSTGSMSDSEIIFGSNDIPDTFSKRSQFGTVDASKSIYESNRNMSSYNRSLSISSDTNGDFANDPRVNTSYRIYEGINNAAFQDFDSPVKTTTSTTTSSTIPETATSFSSTYISGSKIFNDDDDYDLK